MVAWQEDGGGGGGGACVAAGRLWAFCGCRKSVGFMWLQED